MCGACKCHEGWIDDDCSCDNSTSNCVSGPDDDICSGHGKCVCNKCVCNVEGSYSGKFCDKCPVGELMGEGEPFLYVAESY